MFSSNAKGNVFTLKRNERRPTRARGSKRIYDEDIKISKNDILWHKKKNKGIYKKNDDKNQQPKNETTRFQKEVQIPKDYKHNLNKGIERKKFVSCLRSEKMRYQDFFEKNGKISIFFIF